MPLWQKKIYLFCTSLISTRGVNKRWRSYYCWNCLAHFSFIYLFPFLNEFCDKTSRSTQCAEMSNHIPRQELPQTLFVSCRVAHQLMVSSCTQRTLAPNVLRHGIQSNEQASHLQSQHVNDSFITPFALPAHVSTVSSSLVWRVETQTESSS